VLPSGQKLTLGLVTNIAPKIFPFRAYATFQALLPFFKVILEVVFCEDVRAPSALIATIVSKRRPFGFIFNWGNRKLRLAQDNSHVVFGKNFPGEEGMRQCGVMI
jgi:hypothetical protein